MAWFVRSFGLEEDEEEQRRRGTEDDGGRAKHGNMEEEEDETDSMNLGELASATGAAIKEDLSNLGKTFSRGLWGVASFLATPPPETSSVIAAERGNLPSTEGLEEQGQNVMVQRSTAVEPTEREIHGDDKAVSDVQNPGLAEASPLNNSTGELMPVESDPQVVVSPPHEIAPPGEKLALSESDGKGLERPRLAGLQSDFAELRGTVATGFSRITSVLREVTRDEDSGDEDEGKNSLLGSSRSFSSPKESDQGLNSPRRAFDSFLKPLFGNMLLQEKSESGQDDRTQRGADDAKESPGKGEPTYNELEGFIASGIGGLSKFASGLLQMVGEGEHEDQEDDSEDQDLADAGLTEPVVAFARNIATHPETWLEFPLVEDEADDEFMLTPAQKHHVRALAVAAPALEALKVELCPNYLTEGRFWKIYFVLMHSRLSMDEALKLSDPQIVKAREAMLQEIKRRDDAEERDPNLEWDATTPRVQDTKGKLSKNIGKPEDVSESNEPIIGREEGAEVSDSGADKGRSPVLHLMEETEVDEWPDEEPSTTEHTISHSPRNLDTSNAEEDDVSFSDLEDDDTSEKAASSNEGVVSSTSKSPGNVTIDTGNTEAKESSSPMTQSDGTPGKSSSEKGEFKDWFKVDQEDVASAGSSSP